MIAAQLITPIFGDDVSALIRALTSREPGSNGEPVSLLKLETKIKKFLN